MALAVLGAQALERRCQGPGRHRRQHAHRLRRVYEPGSVAVAVEDAFGTSERAVVRLVLTAAVSAEASGGLRPRYENEYVLVVHTRDGMISEVWEHVDVAWAHAQFRGEATG